MIENMILLQQSAVKTDRKFFRQSIYQTPRFTQSHYNVNCVAPFS